MCGGKDKLKGTPSKDKRELKEDLLIIDLWTHGMDSIHDMHAVNTDATSNHSKNSEECLETADK